VERALEAGYVDAWCVRKLLTGLKERAHESKRSRKAYRRLLVRCENAEHKMREV
jgi:hypothetical protein